MERWAELKTLAKDKRQAVYPRLSQCQLSRDACLVRKNASGVEARSHSLETFWSPCLRRGFLFVYRVSADVAEGDGLGSGSWLKQSYSELKPLKP